MANTDDDDVFIDTEGEFPYAPEDIAGDRGIITTPYDAPVRTLLDEIKEKVLIVNPQFQRQSVWKRDRQSKLVESLLLNIPIPVLYFAEDEDGTRVVVDGQQRLRAIEEFHAGGYALTGLEVLAKLNGKRWTDLAPKEARTIRSRTMRCVVISASSPATLRFEMFERLNTGGMPLNDQELRNCVFGGRLNELIDELANSPEWLDTLRAASPDIRMRHHELVLRFFALADALPKNYRPPLKALMNDYMRARRNPTNVEIDALRLLFNRALACVREAFGRDAFRRPSLRAEMDWEPSLNRAVFDIQMLGFLNQDPAVVSAQALRVHDLFAELALTNAEFIDAIAATTAGRRQFYTRLRTWGEALDGIGIRQPYLAELPTV